MILTKIGTDVITVDESNYETFCNDKIHLIKLKFRKPTKEKVYEVFKNYKKTNRFIIQDNIRFYNYVLRDINKKYYVMNVDRDPMVTFFKRNNKIVLNIWRLADHELDFIEDDGGLIDTLSNLEVIIVGPKFYKRKKDIFNTWPGNLIISNGNDI